MDHFRRHHCPEIIDDVRTEDVTESFQDIVKKSFSDAMTALESEMGDRPEKWQWGKVHQLTLAHPVGQVKVMDLLFNLNRGPYPVGGSFHTVSPFAYGYSDRFNVSFGSSHRHIYSVADWDDGLVIIPTGASGVPASNHYCDQTGLYLDHRYRTGLFSEESIIENARYESTFIPLTGSR